MRLAAERAANNICNHDGPKDLDLEKDMQIELKGVNTDSISVLSHQSELKKPDSESKDFEHDIDAVIVETPSDLDLEAAQEESKNIEDSDSVESVGSQLVRLAAAH